jgi:hypothetical protein
MGRGPGTAVEGLAKLAVKLEISRKGSRLKLLVVLIWNPKV